jgi:hypothetical protein
MRRFYADVVTVCTIVLFSAAYHLVAAAPDDNQDLIVSAIWKAVALIAAAVLVLMLMPRTRGRRE